MVTKQKKLYLMTNLDGILANEVYYFTVATMVDLFNIFYLNQRYEKSGIKIDYYKG